MFSKYGYLTGRDGFKEVYRGPEDIPAEYRVFAYPGCLGEQQSALCFATSPEPEPRIKAETADLAELVYKIHSLAGDYMSDANYNLNMLLDKHSSEYLMLLTNDGIYLAEAAHAYEQGRTAFDLWANTIPCSDVRAFAIHVKDQWSAIKGDIAEFDFSERQRDILQRGIKYTGVHVRFKYGEEKNLTAAEWDNLPQATRDRLEKWTMRYEPSDLRALTRYLEAAGEEQAASEKAVEPDAMLIIINRAYTERSMVNQPDLIHITEPAAKDVLARGDAAVYRLLPEGAKKLSPLDAMPNMGNPSERYYNELAIKKDDVSGLDKWAKREVETLNVKRQQERDTLKKSKSHGQER